MEQVPQPNTVEPAPKEAANQLTLAHRIGTAIAAALRFVGRVLSPAAKLLWRALAFVGNVLSQIPPMPLLATKLQPHFAALNRHIEVWRISWEEAKREEPVRRLQPRELEFLPAVVEVQETPPSPVGRTIAYLIVALFAIAIVWATFGKMDIIAVAQGQIVVGDRSKLIQPMETGVIKAIYVHDGQHVKRGEPLIDLDTTAGADRERFSNEYLAALTEVARLKALLADKNDFVAPEGSNPAFVQVQRNRLRDQLAEMRALRNQAEAYRKMLAKQYVSEMQYLDVEQRRAAKAQEHSGALADAETRAKSLAQELEKAKTRAAQQSLTAPVDGVVQQLAVYTVGGVVTPAQQLMVIAPEEGAMEIEAYVENKDIGFVNADQEAEIKVESFPFTHFGTIEGKVVSLSKDAVPLEKPVKGFFYSARVAMAKSTIRVDNGKDVTLTPGMNVSVEIKTGQRRVIEYFLSPLTQALNDSVRER
jgi:membrane fusion protein, hemolysin D